jgi:hypothetical protein
MKEGGEVFFINNTEVKKCFKNQNGALRKSTSHNITSAREKTGVLV